MEPNDPDHYATLGLHQRCTPAQVRSAFRVLVKRHHPDVHAGAPDAVARAQALNAAYEILIDPARRRAYDAELSDRDPTGDVQPPPRTRAAKIERNIAHETRLRIEEFLRGTTLEIRVNDPANPEGPETYSLVVPEETAPGTRFRLPRDAPFEGGHVAVRLRALPGFRFKVRGSDLRCDLRISARRAAQGGSEMIQSATGGPLRVPIPAGIARGEIVCLPREGMPRPRGGRGDLLVRIMYRPEVTVTRADGRG